MKNQKQGSESEHAQSNHTHSHNRTTGECNLEGFTKTGACRIGRANVGFCCHSHSDVTGEGRTKRTAYKREAHHGVR